MDFRHSIIVWFPKSLVFRHIFFQIVLENWSFSLDFRHFSLILSEILTFWFGFNTPYASKNQTHKIWISQVRILDKFRFKTSSDLTHPDSDIYCTLKWIGIVVKEKDSKRFIWRKTLPKKDNLFPNTRAVKGNENHLFIFMSVLLHSISFSCFFLSFLLSFFFLSGFLSFFFLSF